MAYFAISAGLRGCYMPDSCQVIRVNTRRELKEYLESEAYHIRQCGYIGLSKRAIAWLAAVCWRNRNRPTLDFVAPYRAQCQDSWPYGLFCSMATRRDYLEYLSDNEGN
jgi:hypothetical protein